MISIIDQWKDICDDISILLNDIALNGMTKTNSSNIKETETEISQILSLIPSYISDFQKKSKEKRISKSNTDLFIGQIDVLKKQAEIALTIFSEFQQETSSAKMQNIIYTWELRDEIV